METPQRSKAETHCESPTQAQSSPLGRSLTDAFKDAHWGNPFSAVSRSASNVVDYPEVSDAAYLDYMAGGGHHFGGTVKRQDGFVTVTVDLD